MAAGLPRWRDAIAAVDGCPIVPRSGEVWRCHGRQCAGDDAAGSLKATGRFNRGRDRFAEDRVWPSLYAGLAQHVALGERLRHTTPAALRLLCNQRFSRIRVRLGAVLDRCAPDGCARVRLPGVGVADLCRPLDYGLTRAIAANARLRAEALRAPSCTRFPEGNPIIFPDRLAEDSLVEVVATQDPGLFVDWDSIT